MVMQFDVASCVFSAIPFGKQDNSAYVSLSSLETLGQSHSHVLWRNVFYDH
jgi:hypothetical protein